MPNLPGSCGVLTGLRAGGARGARPTVAVWLVAGKQPSGGLLGQTAIFTRGPVAAAASAVGSETRTRIDVDYRRLEKNSAAGSAAENTTSSADVDVPRRELSARDVDSARTNDLNRPTSC